MWGKAEPPGSDKDRPSWKRGQLRWVGGPVAGDRRRWSARQSHMRRLLASVLGREGGKERSLALRRTRRLRRVCWWLDHITCPSEDISF